MARQHDREFDAFMTASWPSLYRTAMLLVGDHYLAEDLLQSTMAKVYRAWPRVSRVEYPRAYARTVLSNEAISWARKRSSGESPTDDLPHPIVEGPEQALVEAAQMWQLLDRLTPRQRAVMVLRYYEDMSEVEIASSLGISTGSVKTHAHHALRAMGQLLEEHTNTRNGGGAA